MGSKSTVLDLCLALHRPRRETASVCVCVCVCVCSFIHSTNIYPAPFGGTPGTLERGGKMTGLRSRPGIQGPCHHSGQTLPQEYFFGISAA
jgi:hypothetical protein